MPDARDTILQAAARCIARKGERGLRVLDVAKEAGVSSGLLYYHFDDRGGLLAATLEHINSQALGHRGRGGRPIDPTERLLSLLVEEIGDDADLTDSAVAWNEIRASAVFDATLREHLARTTEAWQADIATAVRAAQESAGIRGHADADDLALALTALVEGITARWLSGQLDTDRARTALRDSAARLVGCDHDERVLR